MSGQVRILAHGHRRQPSQEEAAWESFEEPCEYLRPCPQSRYSRRRPADGGPAVLRCPSLQDERVNTVHQEPKFQSVPYIRDVIDGMIEYCGWYNVIVGDSFLSHSMIIFAT